MELTLLGWAGVELRHGDATIVIDPIRDTMAVFEQAAHAGMDVAAPAVVPAAPGAAVAGLLTHRHRDHADAGALQHALRSGAPVLEPELGSDRSAATRQAERELDASGLRRRQAAPWSTMHVDPFQVTALPAVDGLGDPQISWLVEAGGVRVLHLGDTMYHGHWWRIATQFDPIDIVLVPINGPITTFPHLTPPSPLPVAMDPEQAAAAVRIVGARIAIAIHHDGYRVEGVYEPAHDALARFRAAAEAHGTLVLTPDLGVAFDVPLS